MPTLMAIKLLVLEASIREYIVSWISKIISTILRSWIKAPCEIDTNLCKIGYVY